MLNLQMRPHSARNNLIVSKQGHVMSKFILKKRLSGFTTVSNNVINILKGDLECLGFYLYLLSLPDNWEFYKTQLSKECKIGIKKVDKLLSTLRHHGLVKYGQERNEKGQFERFYLEIYDVDQVPNKVTADPILADSPEGHFCRTVETVGRIGEAIKEETIKEERKEQKKKKAFVQKAENAKKHDFAESMNKMASEKRHIEKHEGLKKQERSGGMPDEIRQMLRGVSRAGRYGS